MAEQWAQIPGKDAFDRPETMLVEPRDNGARVLLSTPPAGLLLDWRELDQLIHRLVRLRQAMPGAPSGT